MSVVATNHSSDGSSSLSASTMESSPLQILSGSSSFLDYVKGMMECGVMDSDNGDSVEVSYDGKADRIVHSQRQQRSKRRSSSRKKKSSKQLAHEDRKEVSKTHEYIHVDDMTDEEIEQSWYTNDDIKKFRREKKDERRLRKQRIQKERMKRYGIQEQSDGESDYSSEAEYEKAVSWGDSDSAASDSDVSDQERTTPNVAKPVLKKTFSDKTLLANGMAFRRMKTAQRTTMEQRRLAAMHKAFYQSGILFRGDKNRMERFFHLSHQFDDEDVWEDVWEPESPKEQKEDVTKIEEDQEQVMEQTTVVIRQDLIDSKADESKGASKEAKTKAVEPEVVILKDFSPGLNKKGIAPAKRSTDATNEGEEKTEMFPPDAMPESSHSPIANMDMVLSLQPNPSSKHHQRQQSHVSSPDSFTFPSYPAIYDNPSKDQDYFEYRMEEVLEERQRSTELVGLSKKYQTFRRKLLNVVKSVRSYQKAIAQMDLARSACLNECSQLYSEPNPTGKVRPGTFQFAMEKSSIAKLKDFAESEQDNRAKEFQECVLDYAAQWEDSVTNRVDKELKQVKKLQNSRSHYEKKVEGLRKKVNGLDNKGKGIPADLLEKLERNELKLKDAWETHEWNASRLCALIEQVTEFGWKDLLPLVSNLLKYEFNRAGGELAMYGKFPLVMDAFQQTFRVEPANVEPVELTLLD